MGETSAARQTGDPLRAALAPGKRWKLFLTIGIATFMWAAMAMICFLADGGGPSFDAWSCWSVGGVIVWLIEGVFGNH